MFIPGRKLLCTESYIAACRSSDAIEVDFQLKAHHMHEIAAGLGEVAQLP